MEKENELEFIRKENRKLKQEKEVLLKIIDQMKKTLNRLLEHYMRESVEI